MCSEFCKVSPGDVTEEKLKAKTKKKKDDKNNNKKKED